MKSNMYMQEVERKYLGKNPIKRFFNRMKHKKFLKKISDMSHSIGTLWFFCDFIKLAELIYFFDNKKNSYIYSSSSYSYGENGFIINDEKNNNVVIKCKLFSDDQKILIEVKRTNGSNMITEFSYSNNEWNFNKFDSEYSNVLVDNTLGIINKAIVYLIDFCWYAKGSYNELHL